MSGENMPRKDKKAAALYSKEYYQRPEVNARIKERVKVYNKEYRLRPGVRDRARVKIWKSKGIKMTVEMYNKMFEEQNGCCSICGTYQSSDKRNLDVDHCHTTGKVRGLLCHNCNVGIGHFSDDIDLLLSAVSYLKQEYNNVR